jgi:hypothetical protein
MVKINRWAAVGATAFAVGLSWAGPQALGVAAADSSAHSATAAGPTSGHTGAKTAHPSHASTTPKRAAASTATHGSTHAKTAVAAGAPTSLAVTPTATPHAVVKTATASSGPLSTAAGWIDGLVAPIRAFVEGAVLLVRRTFFDQAPTIAPVQTTGQTSGPIGGSIGAVDPEGDPIKYRVVQSPLHGTVAINSDGSYAYTPNADFRGTDIFTVAATDTGSHLNLLNPARPASAEANVLVQQGDTTNKITFKFQYATGAQYWTRQAKLALQWSAVEISSYLVVAKPVTLAITVTGGYVRYRNAGTKPNGEPKWEKVCQAGFCSSTLASASSPLVNKTSDGFYPTVVQRKIITGADANGAASDGSIKFNFGQSWGYGDTISKKQYDFEATAMHELMHTLGFTDGLSKPGANTDQNWNTYDQFITNSSGVKAIDGTDYTWDTAYDPNITGGNGGLYFGGPKAVAAYGGPVPLFTPPDYDGGSTGAHLDDKTFTNPDPTSINAKKMMNAADSEGLGVRTLSPVEIGILQDLGYTVVS